MPEGEAEAVGETGEGVKRYKPSIIKQAPGDAYSIKNMANNTVISLYRERWLLDLS